MSATDLTPPPPAPAPRSRATTIAVVLVLVAFVSGVLVGVAGDRIYLWKTRPHRGGPPPRWVSERIVERLDKRLDLSDQQRAELERIVERRRVRMDAIWSRVGPQVHAELEAANAEIEKILTPEQRAEFAKMKMRFRGHHRRPQ